MTLNVSLASTESRNEWSVIVRLIVSQWTRVIDTVLNTDKLK